MHVAETCVVWHAARKEPIKLYMSSSSVSCDNTTAVPTMPGVFFWGEVDDVHKANGEEVVIAAFAVPVLSRIGEQTSLELLKRCPSKVIP